MPRKIPNSSNAQDNAPDRLPISGDWAAVKAVLSEKIEKGRADRVMYQVKIIRGDFVLRDIFKLSIGNIYSVYRTQVLSLDNSTGSMITAFCGIDKTQENDVRKIIGELLYDAMGRIVENMKKYVTGAAE